MKFQRISIATGRIHGLLKPPHYFEEKCFYVWSISFSEPSTLKFFNLPFIKAGDTEEEGQKFYNKMKENFKKAKINEADKVSIIFEDSGYVIAIGKHGEDIWLDVNDKFIKKTFKELNIIVCSLSVC